MAKRYRKTYTVCDTEQQAMALCVKCNTNDYLRKHHPANIRRSNFPKTKESSLYGITQNNFSTCTFLALSATH